jgi:PAS domain S-box-containing protein
LTEERSFRDRAEEAWQGRQRDLKTSSLQDVVPEHELEVLQIEVELQHDELVRMQRELEEARRLSDQIVDAVFVTDGEGRFLDANRAGCELVGYTLAELKTLGATDLLIPEELPRLAEQFPRFASGSVVRNEWRFRRKDGALRVGDVAGRLLPDRRYQVIVRDITEQKHAEEALVRRLQFETFLFDLSRTFIGLPDEEVDVNMARGLARVGEFLDMDRVTVLELSGDSAEMAVAYSWSAPGVMNPPPSIAKGTQPWWVGQVLRGEISLASDVDDLPEEAAAEKEYLRQRGVASAASIPLKVSGEIAGAISFVTVNRHVTWTPELVNQLRPIGDILWNALKRRRAMQALKAAHQAAERAQRASEALRASEDRYRGLAEQIVDGIIITDPTGNPLDANHAACDLFGCTLDELKNLRPEDALTAEELRVLPEQFQRLAKGEIVRSEFRYRRKDGSIFTAEAVGRQLPDGRLQAVVRDISERKRLEQERTDEARLKDEFLAFLGHELRNPLAAISTAVHVLSIGAMRPHQREKMEEIIARQTTVMRRLVDDLLDLERITHGRIELKLHRVDLAECLQRAVAAAQPTVATRKQELLLRLPPESVQFMADGTRLDQIVGNLLSNASKYTGTGGRIELSGAKEGSEVIILCKDSGQGILPESLEEIFKPFARGRKTDLGYGEASLGIGLALSRRLAELHGGAISVKSGGANLGSEFTVRLPLVAEPSSESVAGEANSARVSRRARDIVIVEDNPSVATTLQVALEQAGHSVQLFADGPSTLAAVSRLRADALLIDIGLPGMDGYELAAKLKQQSNTKDALRIAVSGFKQRERSGQTSDAFDCYLNKPVDIGALLALLDKH